MPWIKAGGIEAVPVVHGVGLPFAARTLAAGIPSQSQAIYPVDP